MKINKFLSIAGIFICASVHSQNLIMNGSFENNNASGNTLNLTGTWSSTVANCFEVDGGSMDLITSNSCGTASDGNWFVTCSPQNGLWPYMAFSFKLYSPLIAGAQYNLTFDKRFCGPNSSPIDIGISNDSTQLGTIFHTFAAPLVNTWATESYTFLAMFTANYLTVNVGVAGGTGTVGLDNFILQPAANGITVFANQNSELFLNSSTNILSVSFPTTVIKYEIDIYNVTGTKVYQSEMKNQKSEINLSPLPRGVYVLKIYAGEKSYPEKIIIR